MKISAKIILRTNFTNASGKHPVCLRFIKNRHQRLISLNIFVKKCDWSVKQSRVNKSDFEHTIKNKKLTKLENKAKNIIDNYIIQDKPLEFNEFTRLFKSSENESKSFYS